jgi:cytochrome b involved in lipid metabolism
MNKDLFLIPILILVVIVGIALAFNSGNADRCIITIYNRNYDVTTLRDSHPGGDIYICGTDMSGMYADQHGSNIERLEPYLVP